MKYDVTRLTLATEGTRRIAWAERQMPVLALIRARFAKTKPLRKTRIAACLHVTTETAVLMRTLKAGGASVVLCASNPLSTQDTVAASLVKIDRISVFARHGENRKTYYRHLTQALATRPVITMDDGADLVTLLHTTEQAAAKRVYGSTEETTTGVIRLRSMERRGVLRFPVIAVNDSSTKHFFDNRYGTGQSTIDGITRATNLLWAGKVVVVSGYGWCGRGVSMRARGMGSRVIVTEVDPLKALEAVMDGFDVMPLARAATEGDVFITVTGNTSIIREEHFRRMKDGAIVANSGHFNVELDLQRLAKLARRRYAARHGVEAFELRSGRTVYVLGEGRLVNLAAAEGHPAAVMDMSFANQALAAEYVVKHHRTLENKVHVLPTAIDQTIAALKLKSMGLQIDRLTPAQAKYLDSWTEGT